MNNWYISNLGYACGKSGSERGGHVKKLLLTEGLLACFFLVLLLGFFGKYIMKEQKDTGVNTSISGISQNSDGILAVYPGRMQETFSPLSYGQQGEENVLAMCFEKLLLKDRNGVKRNQEISENWDGREGELTQISVQYDAEKGLSTMTLAINPREKTVKGKKVNADDLIFNFYLRCDVSSGEEVPFGGVLILGQEEYMYGTEKVTERKREVQKMLEKPSDALKKQLQDRIIKQELLQEFEWVKGLYQDEAYEFISNKYEEAKDLFAYYYAYQTKYSSEGKSEEEVLEDILGQYGWDYKKLSKVTGQDYDGKAQRIALNLLLQDKKKDTVTRISGIERKDDNTVVIRYFGKEEDAEKLCDIWLLPLEEYGDKAGFDGIAGFGFIKGSADDIYQKSCQMYSGTGAFYMQETGEEEFTLLRNPNYLGKKAELRKIRVLRKEFIENRDIVEALLREEADIIMAKKSKELENLLANRGTGASYSIRKVDIDTSQSENCFLYRTSYVNTPSLPKEITEYQTLFQQINLVKVNSNNN